MNLKGALGRSALRSRELLYDAVTSQVVDEARAPPF